MIIDKLSNAALYENISERIKQAFQYLLHTDLNAVAPGKYTIDGDNIFVIVQEYETLDAANEQMEAHKKHIDVQYMISGEEMVGHALFNGQAPSKEYSKEEDYMLFADTPSFFTKLAEGTFMIFFPTDLHMPCIKVNESKKVKKAVVKVKI
jgi:YhcH/YjgK/YiaL family protein